MRIPVVPDTDIGTDIDDTWALAMLLRSPDLDLRLVVTASGDTAYRARVACRLLEAAARSDVAVGPGVPSEPSAAHQAPCHRNRAGYHGQVPDRGNVREHRPWIPLDTCDDAVLRGERYAAIRDADDDLLRALMENYRVWADHQPGAHGSPEERSSTLFDTVAVYLATSEERLEIEQMRISVTEDGRTVRDAAGVPVRVAIRWTDHEGYLDHLTMRLLGDERRI